jgi:hypothetical protein
MKRRVFEEASGYVRIMVLNEKLRLKGESDAAFAARMFPIETTKQPELVGLTFHDIDESDISTDRENRHKFRCKEQGGKMVCVVDSKVK